MSDEREERLRRLRDERERIGNVAAEKAEDVAAILIARPMLRRAMLDELPPDVDVMLRVLGWVDELVLQDGCDDLMIDIECRAQVAMATTPRGIAALNREVSGDAG